jgi:hypothetical protein
MMPASRDQQLDPGRFDHPLLTLYPQDPVAIIQVEIDPAMGKGPLQKQDDLPGSPLVLHVCLENLYIFHTDTFIRSSK